MRAHLCLNANLVDFQRITQELTEHCLTPKHVTSHSAERRKETQFEKHTQSLVLPVCLGRKQTYTLWVLKSAETAAGRAGGQTGDERMIEKAADHFGSKKLSRLYC